MGSFKNKMITSSEDILARQKSKTIIYVEGESDKKIFEQYWFVELLEKVSFRTADGCTGCSSVVNTVADQRRAGTKAFGIVDRDKLMSDLQWELLRETSDSEFENAWKYPSVKITRRWELESYLIEPSAIEAFFAPAENGRPLRSLNVVEAELLDHANALVPFAALNQAMHLHCIGAPKDGYTALDTREKVELRIRNEKLKSHPHISNDYHLNLPLIDAFAKDFKSAREKLNGLLRTVNGKAMLERLKRKAGINVEITYLLARDLKQNGAIPAELEDFVRQCCN